VADVIGYKVKLLSVETHKSIKLHLSLFAKKSDVVLVSSSWALAACNVREMNVIISVDSESSYHGEKSVKNRSRFSDCRFGSTPMEIR
jgi:hypothetical protein